MSRILRFSFSSCLALVLSSSTTLTYGSAFYCTIRRVTFEKFGLTRNFLYLLSRKTIRASITSYKLYTCFSDFTVHLSGESYIGDHLAHTPAVPPSPVSRLLPNHPPDTYFRTTVHASRALTGHDVFSCDGEDMHPPVKNRSDPQPARQRLSSVTSSSSCSCRLGREASRGELLQTSAAAAAAAESAAPVYGRAGRVERFCP